MTAAFVARGIFATTYHVYVGAYWQDVVYPQAGRPGRPSDFWTSSQKLGGAFIAVPATGAAFTLALAPSLPAAPSSDGLNLLLFPHPFLYDGRHANKPWAQEVPEPISTYSWGTWVEIHPETAEKLGLADGDLVKIETDTGSISVGWFGSRGIRKDTVAVVMGNGHQASGRYTRFGANPMTLLASVVDAQSGGLDFSGAKARLSRAGEEDGLYAMAGHIDMGGRGLNYTVSADDLGKGTGPATIVPIHHVPVDPRLIAADLNDMYPEPEHPTYRFAMAVDLNRCTGCGACEAACHAENNIPVVGPDQMHKSRYMGWIRLSRYWEGEGETPDMRFQPVMCQHCSHAPCEGVCPVLATYHNLDGLNAMIYNRCVGTRYCGNNCPYTARRFNYHWFKWPEPFNLMLNPDVMAREVGVMEKCTFCVQRVREAKDHYRDTKQIVPNDALRKLPACAQACPADAMTFGNLKDPESDVAKLFGDERAYAMLSELNTKPAVRYLARIHHGPSALHHGGGHNSDHAEGAETSPPAGHH